MCHTWYFEDHPKDLTQVDSEKGDMGEFNMIMENIINNACCTFIKMPEHREDEFTEIRTESRCTGSSRTWGSPSCSWWRLSISLVAPLSKSQYPKKINPHK